MNAKCLILVVTVFVLGLWCERAGAFVLINEVLADPPAGLAGDANKDGAGSAAQDEFIELFNGADEDIDVSGWYLSDALKPRHIFSAASRVPGRGFLVVFAGGAPFLPGVDWQVASSGALSLNNDGDGVSLFDRAGALVDQVSYGSEGGHDRSLVRWPEGAGDMLVLHSGLPEAGGRSYSPGTFVDGTKYSAHHTASGATAAVPEMPEIYYVGLGLVAIFLGGARRGSFITA
jgi:hypothetical protein